MSKSIPSWASKLTCDIPLNELSEELKPFLRPYAGQVLSLVWTRLPITVRSALTAWWEND